MTIRRALLLSLGEYRREGVYARRSQGRCCRSCRRSIATTPIRAFMRRRNGCCGQWKQEAWLKQVNDEWAKDKEQREKRLDGIKQLLTKDKEKTPPQWYVNGQGQTMVVIPGPVEFVMGSPTTEAGRHDDENQHKKRIGRTFALAAKSVTVEQYRQFDEGLRARARCTPDTADLPVVGIVWYQAAAYCNWLSKEEGIPEDQWCYEIEGRASDEAEGELLESDGLSAAHGSGDGICDPCGGDDEPVLRRDGRVAAEVCVVHEELAGEDVAGGEPEAERSWVCSTCRGTCIHGVRRATRRIPKAKAKEPEEDKEDMFSINNQDSRVLRGGSFVIHASNVRSAYRNSNVPTNRELQRRFSSGEDFYALTPLLLYPLPRRGRKLKMRFIHLYTMQ